MTSCGYSLPSTLQSSKLAWIHFPVPPLERVLALSARIAPAGGRTPAQPLRRARAPRGARARRRRAHGGNWPPPATREAPGTAGGPWAKMTKSRTLGSGLLCTCRGSSSAWWQACVSYLTQNRTRNPEQNPKQKSSLAFPRLRPCCSRASALCRTSPRARARRRSRPGQSAGRRAPGAQLWNRRRTGPPLLRTLQSTRDSPT